MLAATIDRRAYVSNCRCLSDPVKTLSVCLCISLSLTLWPSVRLSVRSCVCRSVCLSPRAQLALLPRCLSAHLLRPVTLSITVFPQQHAEVGGYLCPSVGLSVCLSVCLRTVFSGALPQHPAGVGGFLLRMTLIYDSVQDKDLSKAMGRVASSLYIVTAKKAGVRHAMVASWVTPASSKPLGVSLTIAKDRAMATCR